MNGKKGKLMVAGGAVFILAICALAWSAKASRTSASAEAVVVPNSARISSLLSYMETVDLNSMPALTIEPFTLPTASVDVMRVRLEETYDIAGVGRDTVLLTGWIAVSHSNPRPAAGETEVKWGTAISDTEFVGMSLHGESKIFGPVSITLNPDMPSKGQVGKLNLTPEELAARHRAYLAAIGEPQRDIRTRIMKKGFEGINNTLGRIAKAIGSQDPKALYEQYDPSSDNTYFIGSVGKTFRGAQSYIDFLAPQFTSEQLTVRFDQARVIEGVANRWAVVEVTGINSSKSRDGKDSGEVPFHITQVYVNGKNGWKVKHDSWSVAGDAATIKANRGRSVAGCDASASVSISMPKLDLKMTTQNPVVWYSEVETIPPVGQTASISLSPTKLISAGRGVGTLTSGIVKFREVVKKVELNGSE